MKIKHAAASLRTRIFEPAHVPLQLVPGYESQLKNLDFAIEELEAKLTKLSK